VNNFVIRRFPERFNLATTLLFIVLVPVACASAPLPPAEFLNAAKDPGLDKRVDFLTRHPSRQALSEGQLITYTALR